MTTIRIEKQYLDNLIIYVEKLESHAKYIENNNRILADKIEHLEKKVSNIKRNKLRLKNKYNNLVSQTDKQSEIEWNTVEQFKINDELDWIEIDNMSE
jgi:molecular chaperone GrpE (heat shock protein)